MSATPGISSPRLLVLMAIGIAVNIGLGQIVSTLSLPVFLDSLGTMVVALMAGPLAGLATGLVTNLVWGLVASPTAAAFAPSSPTRPAMPCRVPPEITVPRKPRNPSWIKVP